MPFVRTHAGIPDIDLVEKGLYEELCIRKVERSSNIGDERLSLHF